MVNKYIYLRGMFSIVLAIVVYALVLSFVLDLFLDTSGNVWLEVICFAGIPPFMAFLIGLIVMAKRYRIIIAGILLYLLFALELVYYLSLGIPQFWEFVCGLIGVSVNALGAIIAIFICVTVFSSGKEERQLAKDAIDVEEGSESKKRMSKPSLFLLTLSLLSVPTTYAVMILSAFITLGLSMLLLLIVLELPMIPVIVLLAVGIAPLVGFGVAIRALWSMFISKPQFQPAIKINIRNCPNLKRIIYDVASEVKTKKPDAVILHAEPTFFVLQGKIVTFDGIVRGRVLAIGLPLLRELETLEFQSILAHEFAHFSGRDTMYSAYVVPVYKAIGSSLYDLEGVSKESSSILMKLVNFLLLTHRLFLGVFANYFATIDSMLSRSRELRADWISATIYGSQNFSSALTKVVQIGSHFGEHVEDIALDGKADFFEEYSRVLHSSPSKLEEYLNKAFAETEQDFDTHPTISTRIKSLPSNEVVEGDESLMGYAKEELLGDEKRLSTEYLGYIKNIKEIYEQFLGKEREIFSDD